MVANRKSQLKTTSPDGSCLRLILSQAHLLRADVCLIFQQRLKEGNLANYAEDVVSRPACFKHGEHTATVTGNALSAIPEDVYDVQDYFGEIAADDESKADERICAALKLMLQRTLCAAQGDAAAVDERLNAIVSGASIAPNCESQGESSIAQSLDGDSCASQVLATRPVERSA